MAFDYQGSQFELASNVEPDEPVIVVKDNERIIARKNDTNLRDSFQPNGSLILKNESNKFYFIDDSFYKEKDKNARRVALSTFQIKSPNVVYAFNNGSKCERDYVYYGILPTQTSGTYRETYAEYITSYKVENTSSFSYIYEDWTDGAFEIFINIFFVDDKTSLKSLLKGFSCYPQDLFTIGTDNVVVGTQQYNIPSPIYIMPWDFRRYGDTWKFVTYEQDPSTNVTYNTSIESTYGSNITNNIKEGSGFGSSSTTKIAQSISYQISGTSDVLGEGVLTFCTPVINRTGTSFPIGPVYYTNDVTTGFVRMSVEPLKR